MNLSVINFKTKKSKTLLNKISLVTDETYTMLILKNEYGQQLDFRQLTYNDETVEKKRE